MSAPAPLTPPACDLRGMPFMPLDVVRLLDSDLFALSTGDEFKAAIALWCKAWNQVPAASLPCDDRILARLAGLSHREWAAVKGMALRGWDLCEDGRLYHPVVAEKALEAWAARERQRERARKRWDKPRDGAPEEPPHGAAGHAPADAPAHAAASPAAMQGTGTGTGKKSSDADASAQADDPPDPDTQAWSLAVDLLTKRGGLSEKQGRAFFGGLLKRHACKASELLVPLIHAEDAGTPDLQPYLTAAAQNLIRTPRLIHDRPNALRPPPSRAETRNAVWSQLAAEEHGAPARRAPGA